MQPGLKTQSTCKQRARVPDPWMNGASALCPQWKVPGLTAGFLGDILPGHMHISVVSPLKPSANSLGLPGTITDRRPKLVLCQPERRSQRRSKHTGTAIPEKGGKRANHRRKLKCQWSGPWLLKGKLRIYSAAVSRCPATPRRPVSGSEVSCTCLPCGQASSPNHTSHSVPPQNPTCRLERVSAGVCLLLRPPCTHGPPTKQGDFRSLILAMSI